MLPKINSVLIRILRGSCFVILFLFILLMILTLLFVAMSGIYNISNSEIRFYLFSFFCFLWFIFSLINFRIKTFRWDILSFLLTYVLFFVWVFSPAIVDIIPFLIPLIKFLPFLIILSFSLGIFSFIYSYFKSKRNSNQ